jgi:6,7-dimethyl-8-ribityllumazine synthase
MTDPARPRLAFVQSMWHDDIVDRAKDGFTEVVGAAADIEYFSVPGAFEIPLFARSLAGTGRFDGIVAAGFVVDGGIYRHEFVADAVISGLMRVQLDSGVPVFSCVLTPQQFHEHEDHVRFFAGHMVGKGREVARTALETLEARAAIGSAS